MTSTPPPFPPPAPQQPPSGQPQPHAAQQPGAAVASFWAWVRGLGVTRSSERWVGGVAGGIAARWGVDPLVVRGLFAASVLLGGIGFVLYGLAWALLPEPDGRIHAQELFAGRFDQAMVGIMGLLLVGIGPSRWIAWPWGDGAGWGVLKAIGWVAFIGLVIWLFSSRSGKVGGSASPTFTPGSAPSTPAAAWGSPGGAATSTVPSSTTPPPAPTVAMPAAAPFAAPTTTWDVPSSTDGAAAPTSPTAGAGAFGRLTPPNPPQPAVLTPPRPPKPPKVTTLGPGRRTIGAVVGLGILAVAAILLANRAGVLEVGGQALTLGVLLGLVGLGIVVSGLRGRTSGTLGFLAIVGLVLAPSAFVSQDQWTWGWDGAQSQFGDVAFAPLTAAEASEGVRVAAGEATVDLTDLPLTDGELVVPIEIGAGDVRITVPDGAAVRADVEMVAGNLIWDVDGDRQQRSGALGNDDLTFSSAEVEAGTPPQLVLDIRLGAGQVTIEGENR